MHLIVKLHGQYFGTEFVYPGGVGQCLYIRPVPIVQKASAVNCSKLCLQVHLSSDELSASVTVVRHAFSSVA